jgi:hypothetical protein
MHRVRVGLIGLAWVFLLVAAATVLLHAAEEPQSGDLALENTVQAPSDPLADLGVAPGNPVADEDATAAPSNSTDR